MNAADLEAIVSGASFPQLGVGISHNTPCVGLRDGPRAPLQLNICTRQAAAGQFTEFQKSKKYADARSEKGECPLKGTSEHMTKK